MLTLKKRQSIEIAVSWQKSCNTDLTEKDLMKILYEKYKETECTLLECYIYSRISAKRIIFQFESMFDQSMAPF